MLSARGLLYIQQKLKATNVKYHVSSYLKRAVVAALLNNQWVKKKVRKYVKVKENRNATFQNLDAVKAVLTGKSSRKQLEKKKKRKKDVKSVT